MFKKFQDIIKLMKDEASIPLWFKISKLSQYKSEALSVLVDLNSAQFDELNTLWKTTIQILFNINNLFS